jgi:hypothetical protein
MDSKNRPDVVNARPPSEKLYTLWLALMLTAVVAAGFTLSYFVYAHLVANGPVVSVESVGELWDGGVP